MPLLHAGSLQIHYETAGQGAPVVLLHGNFSCGRWWRPVLERAPSNVAVYAPSTRGCGGSAFGTGGFGFEVLARDLLGFCDALALPRVALVGHSLGGAIATQFAAEFPERVSSLMLIAPPPTAGTLSGNESLARLMRSLDPSNPSDVMAVKALFAWGRTFGLHRHFLRRGLEDMLGATRLPREVMEALLDDASQVSDNVLLGFFSALQHWSPGAALSRVEAPVLVLWGDRDPLIPRAAVEASAKHFPDGRLEVWAGAGHSPMYERPDELASRLFAFAATHP